jgi:hypothetical protein
LTDAVEIKLHKHNYSNSPKTFDPSYGTKLIPGL